MRTLPPQPKGDGRFWLPSLIGWLLLMILLISLLGYCGRVEAFPLRAVSPLGSVTVFEEPCPHPWLKKWKRAELIYKDQKYEACWAADQSSQSVLVIDSEGDLSMLPMAAFQKVQTF